MIKMDRKSGPFFLLSGVASAEFAMGGASAEDCSVLQSMYKRKGRIVRNGKTVSWRLCAV
jgi:hypothetical protein